MTISTELIETYKTLLISPQENNLKFESISEIFEETEEATAKHILYDQYLQRIGRLENQVPKIIFYVIMDEIYKQKKAPDGNIGYCVCINNKKLKKSK